MKVISAKMPERSILYAEWRACSYTDSYEGVVNDKNSKVDVAMFARQFLKPGPKWVDRLFALRNRIVSVFGLKVPSNGTGASDMSSIKFEKGMQAGLFRVFDVTENEIILGEDDKHLKFRVSLLVESLSSSTSQKKLTVTTAVVFNNWFGRLYFLPVKPFHKLIVRKGLKDCLNEIATIAS